MSATIQFTTDTFRPICIKGNQHDADPVEFELQAVGGPGRARLKSILAATSGLANTGDWSPAVQDSVIHAFETGGAVFQEAVLAVRGLKAPVGLLRKVGILREMPAGLDLTAEIAVATGYEFALLCGYWPMLAYEVALRIATISGQAEIDPRFFVWLSTSLGISGIQPGTAGRVGSKRGRGATAGSKTPTGSRAKATSRRSASSANGGAGTTG